MIMLRIKQVIRVTEDEVRMVMAEPEKWALVFSHASAGRDGEACQSSETRIPLAEFSGYSFGSVTERGITEPRRYRSFQLLGKASRRDYSVTERFDPTTQETARFVNVEGPGIIVITQPVAVEYVP